MIHDFFVYFSALTEQRRKAEPTDDLASVIANATIDGEPIGLMEQISYYVIVATAGHDTTSSAMAGGLQALIEHPDQLARLQADPSLIPTAVDEIIRWVTPVKHFMRNVHDAATSCAATASSRATPSCCRTRRPTGTRRSFDDPFRFDVGRTPNKHLAFGFGVHYCLGAMLARMEIKALLTELLPRLRSIELAGEPAAMQTLFVGGLKRLPIRYELA